MKPLLAAFLFGMTLALAGCGGGGDDATKTSTQGRDRYPAVVVDNFMQSCTAGKEERRAYCGCTLDRLSESVSVEDFRQIGISGGKVSARIQRAITQAATACADKL